MNTPICDFVRRYAESDPLRLHMPGHKGVGDIEKYDITEIGGADSLYEASGIIRESEAAAGSLFGADTCYSTEGSSLCIRAMLYLAVTQLKKKSARPLIAAGRNAHKAFLSAAALLDLDVIWLYPDTPDSYLSCKISARELERTLSSRDVTAVYLTSPDYLGGMVSLRSLADVCRRYGVPLLVDNAHGAYLKFLPEPAHPTDLGADMCCDSAHKTLPVLTGGAYLHICTPGISHAQAKNAMALFGSTSPSYLILQSLDAANKYIAGGYKKRLADTLPALDRLRSSLAAHGFTLCGDEPLKLTVSAKPYGYSGTQLSDMLAKQNIICEFADPDFLVMMLTPETAGIDRLESALLSIPRREPITKAPPVFSMPQRAMTIRKAAFSECESVPAAESAGRILAAASVGCPPAVPIAACGEIIGADTVKCFEYYGIEECTVVKER